MKGKAATYKKKGHSLAKSLALAPPVTSPVSQPLAPSSSPFKKSNNASSLSEYAS